jgi:hypothetical protein
VFADIRVMRPDLQQQFIERVTDESYAAFCTSFGRDLGLAIEFRLCEMPVFVSDDLRRQLESASIEIIRQCVSPENLKRSKATLQPRYTVPHESAVPLFSVVDFAITQDQGGRFVPKLIELQGFPSLFGYQFEYASRMIDSYGLENCTPFFGGIDTEQYKNLLKTAIFANHDPAEVALMEIDPHLQKTRPDFVAMEHLIGLQTINIRDVVRHGKGLAFPRTDGSLQPLRRIFNRAIIDELDDLGVELSFAWSDDLDVEWAGHPNWYFRISKYLLPYLDHPSVPKAYVVGDLDELPADIDRYVLKPLYAFAGKGVNVAPTHDDVRAIPEAERDGWILQEKVHYAPCLPTPFGNNFVEIRVMLIWLDEQQDPMPVMSLARTGRGPMMGARYNTAPWTGSSGCLFTDY